MVVAERAREDTQHVKVNVNKAGFNLRDTSAEVAAAAHQKNHDAVMAERRGVEEAKEKAVAAAETAKEKGADALETAKEKGADALETVKEKGAEIVDVAKEKGANAAEVGKSAADTAVDNLKNLKDDIGEGAGKLFGSIKNAVEKATNKDLDHDGVVGDGK